MDRRQRKTRRAIYAAFEDLMSTEHYQHITVARIIEQADIGRSTFYAHFETKDELLSTMCSEMFDHIFEGVSAECTTHSTLDAHDLEGKLAHLLFHLRDSHQGVCGKLLMEGERHFTTYFKKKLNELFNEHRLASKQQRTPSHQMTSATSHDTLPPDELSRALLVSAFCQAVIWWFEHPTQATPEILAHWFMEMHAW